MIAEVALACLASMPPRVHVYDATVDVSVKKGVGATSEPSGPAKAALATLSQYFVCRALPDGTIRWASDVRAQRAADVLILTWPNTASGIERKNAVQKHWAQKGADAPLPAGIDAVEFENPFSLRVSFARSASTLLPLLCHPDAAVTSPDTAFTRTTRGFRANPRAAWGQPYFSELLIRERSEKDARVALAAGKTDVVLGLPGEPGAANRFGTFVVASSDAASSLACLADATDRADLVSHFVDAPSESWAALAGEKPSPRPVDAGATCPPATLHFRSEWPSQARVASRLQVAARRRGLVLTLNPLSSGESAPPGLLLVTRLLPPDDALAATLLRTAHGPNLVPLFLEGVGVRASAERLRPVEFDAFGLPLLEDLERGGGP